MARGHTQQEPRRRRKSPRSAGAFKEGQRVRTADNATLEDQCHPRKIFVGGLPHKTTTQQLRDHFSQFGTIVDAVVLRWPDGRSRGFGYVTFTTDTAVAAVLSQTHRVAGRQIDTKRAVPGTNKLFVGGLPQNCAATELREHFEAFGVVSDAVVMIDPATNRSRGFGFVCFLPGQEGAAAVAAALQSYDHHRIRGKWIEVKSAVSPHKLAASEGGSSQDSSAASVAASEEAPHTASPQQSPQLKPAAPAVPVAPGPVALAAPAGAAPSEPKKVVLPTSTTTMAAALAVMNSPQGVAAARRTKPSPAAACEPSVLPRRVPHPAATSGLPRSVQVPLAHAAVPIFKTPEDGPMKVGGLSGIEAAYTSFLCEGGLVAGSGYSSKHGAFAMSESLQRSLEQLLRQQSLRMVAEKAPQTGEQGKEPAGVELDKVLPSTTGLHGG